MTDTIKARRRSFFEGERWCLSVINSLRRDGGRPLMTLAEYRAMHPERQAPTTERAA